MSSILRLNERNTRLVLESAQAIVLKTQARSVSCMQVDQQRTRLEIQRKGWYINRHLSSEKECCSPEIAGSNFEKIVAM